MEEAITEIPDSYLTIKDHFEDHVDDFKFDVGVNIIDAITKGGLDLAHDMKVKFDNSGEHISNMTSELAEGVTMELARQYDIKVNLDLDAEVAKFEELEEKAMNWFEGLDDF